MAKRLIRSPYGHDRRPVKLKMLPGEGRTEQQHVDACNINNILKRYKQTGVLQHITDVKKRFADVTGEDFHHYMTIVAEAETLFEEQPSEIRNRFKNDPGAFLDFVHDPENAKELVEMNLALPEEKTEPVLVEMTNQTTIDQNPDQEEND